jgi:HEAT repeat protein
VPRFELQFPPQQIEVLASRFPDTDDARYRAAGAAARSRGHYARGEFIAVCRWKTPRSGPKVAANTARAIARLTRRAFATDDEARRMEALLELVGVGVPTASTLLFFAFPDDYPILDVRALESLGAKPRSQYPISFWLDYLGVCRELASSYGVGVRTLDKALWQHSKERAKPVSVPGETGRPIVAP